MTNLGVRLGCLDGSFGYGGGFTLMGVGHGLHSSFGSVWDLLGA